MDVGASLVAHAQATEAVEQGRIGWHDLWILCPSSTLLRPEAPRGHTEGTCGNEGKEKAQQPLGIAGLLNVEAAGIEPAAGGFRRAWSRATESGFSRSSSRLLCSLLRADVC